MLNLWHESKVFTLRIDQEGWDSLRVELKKYHLCHKKGSIFSSVSLSWTLSTQLFNKDDFIIQPTVSKRMREVEGTSVGTYLSGTLAHIMVLVQETSHV